MKKTYDPPLTQNSNAPLFRFDKAIEKAQQRLDTAIDMKRHHTSHNLALEVIREARDGLRKAEQSREAKVRELAQKAAEIKAARS